MSPSVTSKGEEREEKGGVERDRREGKYNVTSQI